MPARPHGLSLHLTVLVAIAAAILCRPVEIFSSQQSLLNDEPAIESALASANDAWRRGDKAVARAEYERTLEAAHRLGLTRAEADAECGLAEVLFAQALYAGVREHGLKALELYERLSLPLGVGRSNQLLGNTAAVMGDYTEARTRARTAVDIFDRAGDRRRRGQATLILLHVDQIDSDQHIRLLARSVDDARAAGDQRLEGEALHSWGDHLFALGRYEQALEKLDQAAAAYEATHQLNALGTVFNSLGRLYRAHGRLDEALKFQLKALDLHERGDVPLTLIQSLNAVAVVYELMGDLTKSRAHYDRALALAERSGSPRIRDFLLANVASVQLHQGEFAAAASRMAQVIANQRDVYVAERNTNLSYAYLKLGRNQDALDAANRAVEFCLQVHKPCINTLDQRAAVHAAMGNYPAALKDVREALDTIETIRSNLVPADFFKQNFHRQLEDVYSAAIALHFQQHEELEALETAELGRSRALLDLLASRDASSSGQVPATGDGVPEHVDASTKSSMRPSVDAVAEQLTFRRGDSAAGPPAADLRSEVSAAPATAEGLIAVAARLKSTLVVYWAGPDELYVWVVRADGKVTARRVPVPRSRLLELVTATSSLTSRPASASATLAPKTITTRGASGISVGSERERAWRELHDLLIAPIHALLPRTPGSLLTIVPQGPLLNLSFAALQDKAGRYLIEDYTLHYVPAGALLQFTSSRRSSDSRSGRLLLVADPTLPPLSPLEPRLPRLPGARNEVRAIAQLVPRGRVTELQSDAASESRVRNDAQGRAVIHFATHAIVRDEDPAGSYLVLARDRNEAQADGILTAQEIYRLDLNADLVVLSACRSAGGRITGDGIATFARAFIYAGTPSLVASLWDVADEPVNRLIPGFYRSWFAGASKARSLRAAQLRFLRELRAGAVRVPTRAGVVVLPEDPLFWAGFVLIGEPD
jgi:CHAT domain-containing protein/tetratricopeptide (TPR) repeat protein